MEDEKKENLTDDMPEESQTAPNEADLPENELPPEDENEVSEYEGEDGEYDDEDDDEEESSDSEGPARVSRLQPFYDKCAEYSQEKRKAAQTKWAVICGIILILSVVVSLIVEQGILSYIYIAVFLVILVIGNIFEKNTGWNLRYFKKLMLAILGIAFLIIILYGIISGQSLQK